MTGGVNASRAGPRGLIIAAPASGSGKTTLTLGLLRALAERSADMGIRIVPAKVGPDYIDPGFHARAAHCLSRNLDTWAMSHGLLAEYIAGMAGTATDQREAFAIVEGVMGLFDSGRTRGVSGFGGTADMARLTGWPVVLVVDTQGMAQSAGAVARGFAQFDPQVHVAGVIFNRVASERHRAMLASGAKSAGVRVFGAMPRQAEIALPSRHLGLVQAEENDDIERLLSRMAELVAKNVDLPSLVAVARQAKVRLGDGEISRDPSSHDVVALRPPGQRIAVASDVAFRFIYPHVLDGWRRAGADISFFSPLADEAARADADAVYLPGGYPELHCGRLASAERFRSSVTKLAARGVRVFGECGGYMVLGEGLVDENGRRHRMLGLLGLETSFAARRLHLGYRHVSALGNAAGLAVGGQFRAHEFHYASIVSEKGEPLFRNLETNETVGLCRGPVAGSFMHLIAADNSG